MISLNIKRTIDNPEYDAEYDKERSRLGISGIYNEKYDENIKRLKTVTASVLEVDITEEQFEAIRKAVLEVF